jgi:alpha-tubulin suppressor-like RCC1 family protein
VVQIILCFLQVYSLYLCCIYIVDNGDVYSFGAGAYGKLGTGNVEDTAAVTKIDELRNITQVACGGDHSLAVDSQGSLWAWG